MSTDQPENRPKSTPSGSPPHDVAARLMAQGLTPSPSSIPSIEPSSTAPANPPRWPGKDPNLLAMILGEVPDLPGIELQNHIGRGGMGVVFEARQVSLDRKVAVKVLAPEIAADPVFISRIEREAKTMANLRHPNLVAIYQFEWLPTGGAAIIMEWVGGGTLRDVINANPHGVPVDEALELVRQIMEALDSAHRSGVIHRDMKPENVLIHPDGQPRVTDFGLAMSVTQRDTLLTSSGTTVGTLDYMPPEQTKGSRVDERSDIYSLGVLFYELLTGQLPRGNFDPPHVVRPGLPQKISAVVMRALRNDPQARFQSMAEMLSAFDKAINAKKPRRAKEIVLILGVAFLLVPGAVFLGNRFTQRSPAPPVSEITSEVFDEEANATLTADVQANQAGPPASGGVEWRDVLGEIDLAEASVRGSWQRINSGVQSDNTPAILSLTGELPESYDVRLVFRRLTGIYSVAVFFSVHGAMLTAELDAWQNHLSGVQTVEGIDLRHGQNFPFTIRNGQRYELVVRVRPDRVVMAVDGQDQMTFPIAPANSFTVVDPWNWQPDVAQTGLAVGSFNSSTHFEIIEWRPADPSDP